MVKIKNNAIREYQGQDFSEGSTGAELDTENPFCEEDTSSPLKSMTQVQTESYLKVQMVLLTVSYGTTRTRC